MNSLSEFPEIMAQAREDLCGNMTGRFSPENWDMILREAHLRLRKSLAAGNQGREAWQNVIREFHQESFWGFSPNWRPPAQQKPKKRNLGFSFVWMIFSTFVITLMAVVWLGQIYTITGDPKDAYFFFASIVLVLFNFGYFLWQSRHYVD